MRYTITTITGTIRAMITTITTTISTISRRRLVDDRDYGYPPYFLGDSLGNRRRSIAIISICMVCVYSYEVFAWVWFWPKVCLSMRCVLIPVNRYFACHLRAEIIFFHENKEKRCQKHTKMFLKYILFGVCKKHHFLNPRTHISRSYKKETTEGR